jgi:hypothetical protein
MSNLRSESLGRLLGSIAHPRAVAVLALPSEFRSGDTGCRLRNGKLWAFQPKTFDEAPFLIHDISFNRWGFRMT